MKSWNLLCVIWVGGLGAAWAEEPAEIIHSNSYSMTQKVQLLKEAQVAAAALEDYENAGKIKVMIETLEWLEPEEGVTTEANSKTEDVKKPIAKKKKGKKVEKDLDFSHGFLTSVSMILVSELGDKTFFIAAIMAMRHNRVIVFASAIAALIVMTILSAAMGFALPNIMPRRYTHYAAAGLFLFFGVRLLKDAAGMEGGASEELEEVESELNKKTDDPADVEANVEKKKTKDVLRYFFSPVFIQCFTMTFLAEWGDRSQIATIALAAAKNPYGVTLGGIVGHSCCTGLAVVGGRLLATKISERVVVLIGGCLFLVFALHSVVMGPEDM